MILEIVPDVISVLVGEDYNLYIEFADNKQKNFDFKPLLEWKCYEKLRDEAFFKLACVENGTVVWPGNIDVDPEILYE